MNLPIENYSGNIFERIKHLDEFGNEFWSARELSKVLGYNEFRFFEHVVDKAVDALNNSGASVADHIVHTHGMVNIGSSARRSVPDYKLSRLACYLIAQNGDPQKENVALAQNYFAIQTRKQELAEQYETLTEDQKRLLIRGEMIAHNKSLAEAAQGEAACVCPHVINVSFARTQLRRVR